MLILDNVKTSKFKNFWNGAYVSPIGWGEEEGLTVTETPLLSLLLFCTLLLRETVDSVVSYFDPCFLTLKVILLTVSLESYRITKCYSNVLKTFPIRNLYLLVVMVSLQSSKM